ncbi:MAG: hypothetical protein NC395_04050 [Prevotella sp.]|nr:hypothetical protein [Prevotella sp.]
MINRKILLGTVLAAAVCLSACAEENAGTSETSPETVAAAEISAATVSETSAVTEAAEAGEETEDIYINYFSSRGFEIKKSIYRFYSLTVDLDNFKDVADPFEGLDKDHFLSCINSVTLKNVDGWKLDFLSWNKYNNVYIPDYSGNADFSGLENDIVFGNYMGGDLSTVDFAEKNRTVEFAHYSGEYPLNNMPKDGVAKFVFSNFGEDVDFGFIAEYPNVSEIRLYGQNIDKVDFNFIRDCKNLKYIMLTGKSVDCAALAEILPDTSVTRVNIIVEDYSSEEAELLMKALPSGSVRYSLDSTPWDNDKNPTEGVAFFTNMRVYSDAKITWDVQTGEAGEYNRSSWIYSGSLVCTFSNFTEEIQTVNSVRIFRDEKGKNEAMTFADGTTSHKLDFAIDPGTNSDLDINREIFPFAECETGIYKVVFDVGGEQLEQRFFLFNGDKDFLTEEQREVFDKAYKITEKYFGCSTYLSQEYADAHTAEEFLENLYEGYTREYAYGKSLGTYIDGDGNLKAAAGDRGGDISEQGNYFMPIYADENEVLFKNFVIHGHEDYPYYIWFAEENFHMVKTDEGWRFDKFDLWY